MQSIWLLRGAAAIWIVVFHCFIFDKNPFDLQDSSLMSLFFLISGFSLTIGYSIRLLQPTASDNATTNNPSDGLLLAISTEPVKSLSFGQYYLNRLLRVLPVYYICTSLALIPTLYGPTTSQ